MFRVTRWAIAWFVLSTAVAMLLYPGGTYRDHSTAQYSFFKNFLSDLGNTVAWGGEPNPIGAAIFIVGELVLVLGLLLFFTALFRVYAAGPARGFAIAAAATGLVSCAGFIAAALLPADRFLAAHIQAAILGFRATLLSSALFAIATVRDPRFSRRAAAGWAVLTIVMAAYVGVIEWGPSTRTSFGLTFQVTAQKTVVTALLGIFAMQSSDAERIATAETAVPARPQAA